MLRRIGISSVAALALAAAVVGPASADDAVPDAIDALDVVPGLADEASTATATELTPSALGFEATGGSGEATVIERSDADASAVTYVEDGQTVLENTSTDTDTVVQQLPDGGRVLEIIGSQDAPTEFAYDVDVPDGMEIIEHEDGSLLIGTEEQVGDQVTVEVDGVIGAPWAVDATGQAVPATYEVEGGSITMHVEHSADVTYPVVADPAYTAGGFRISWSIWRPHIISVELDKETSAIAEDVGVGVCVGVAVVVGPVAGIICGLENVAIRAAARFGYCQKWDLNLLRMSMDVGIYRGGFCS